MQNMLSHQHVGKPMSRECAPCDTTSPLNSKTDEKHIGHLLQIKSFKIDLMKNQV